MPQASSHESTNACSFCVGVRNSKGAASRPPPPSRPRAEHAPARANSPAERGQCGGREEESRPLAPGRRPEQDARFGCGGGHSNGSYLRRPSRCLFSCCRCLETVRHGRRGMRATSHCGGAGGPREPNLFARPSPSRQQQAHRGTREDPVCAAAATVHTAARLRSEAFSLSLSLASLQTKRMPSQASLLSPTCTAMDQIESPVAWPDLAR